MKLHRRTVRVDGQDLTAISLRPGTTARFATNRYRESWHVLSDRHGSTLLSRLLWGLSYQRRAGTLLVIDQHNLDPDPFEAEPSDPIVLVPANLTPLRGSTARALRHRLPFTDAPEGTVRWHTAGMDEPLAELRRYEDAKAVSADERTPETTEVLERYRRWRPEPADHGCRIERDGGLIVIAARPELLRRWALWIAIMGDRWYDDGRMDYLELESGPGEVEGLVQIFPDYARRVSTARVARAEILAELDEPRTPEEIRELVNRRSRLVRDGLPRGPEGS